MPPKGWRKNAEGLYPTPNKDSELTSIDDILFPRATVQKIAKQYLNDEDASSMMLGKESVLALQRSATVFVSHILHHARQISKETNRKTVNAQDILSALEQTEFAGFVGEVKEGLSQFEETVTLKKKMKAETKAQDTSEPLTKKLKVNEENESITVKQEDEDEDEEEEEDDDDEDDDEEADAEREENDEIEGNVKQKIIDKKRQQDDDDDEIEEDEENQQAEDDGDDDEDGSDDDNEGSEPGKNPHQVLEAEFVELEKSQE